jgi:hypothetical protein
VGPQGPQGETGVTGAAGTARAYARVFQTVAFDANRTSGFTTVTRPYTGIYCLTAPGINSANRPAVTSVEAFNTTAPRGNATAMWAQNTNCPASSQFEVHTERSTAVGDAALSNTVAFTIIVP